MRNADEGPEGSWGFIQFATDTGGRIRLDKLLSQQHHEQLAPTIIVQIKERPRKFQGASS